MRQHPVSRYISGHLFVAIEMAHHLYQRFPIFKYSADRVTEALSYILAERFATKCFTPLELTHFKDNFFSHALDQNGLKYWDEKTLSDFLGIPDNSEIQCALDAGPVLFRMVSFLGAFPFQKTLAPSVLTFDAMVKTVVLLTERYGKVLRRGNRDRVKLLFGSLADVARKTPDRSGEVGVEEDGGEGADTHKLHPSGYAIDVPANDDEEDEDGDELALAALESLDAIEVFKHDQYVDRTVYESRVSVDTFRRLLMLLLVIAPLKPLEYVQDYTTNLSTERTESIRKEAENILASFTSKDEAGGISYKQFMRTVSGSLPYLFDPLTPLFEHLLFSKNFDFSISRTRIDSSAPESTDNDLKTVPAPTPVMLPGAFESAILNQSLISHLSFFLPSPSLHSNFLQSGTRLHPVFSTAAHGSSLTSFSHNVLTWQAPSLLILQGIAADQGQEEQDDKIITLGAYLSEPWTSSSRQHSPSQHQRGHQALPCLFQLSPEHIFLPGNPSPPSPSQNQHFPTAHFSTTTGLALGCQIPPPSRTTTHSRSGSGSQIQQPVPHGAGSLIIDKNLEIADLHVGSVRHDGVFLPPASACPSGSDKSTKTSVDIYNLEIWGIVPANNSDTESTARGGQSAMDIQRRKWEFEAREVERRKGLNLRATGGDGDTEGARWLLESAGLVGGHGSGGSV